MKNIDGVDAGELAEWSLAQMYRSMKLAEQAYVDYGHNKSKVSQDDLNQIASDQQMHVRHAQMYAAIFTAAETANSSIRHSFYREALRAVDAHLAPNQIPRQTTPVRN